MGKKKNKTAIEEEPKTEAQNDVLIEPPSIPAEVSETPQKLITLVGYCNSLGFDGINKFAFSRITAYCKENKIGLEAKPLAEWEKIYIGIQNS